MALTGIQKAAILLTALDQGTATELLKGLPQETVQKVAMELSRWDGKLKNNSEKLSLVAYEFCSDLSQPKDTGLNIKNFIGSLMPETDSSHSLQNTMQQAAIESDPYIIISDASAVHLTTAIENEPPQAIAIVLSEVDPKLCTDVLNRLPEEKAQLTVWRMTQGREVSGKTIRRIGEIVSKRLVEMQSVQDAPVEDNANETLRRVALVLNGMPKDKRKVYLKQIEKRDSEMAKAVRMLMVTWDDIIKIEDRSLQEILRNLEASVLAKAMHGAEPEIIAKIKSNISERLTVMIEEEVSLMGEVRKKEVLEARDEVAVPLREALESGELVFIEEDDAG